MSRYFSEAMNDHPEFQRLNQRIRDLENGTVVKELQETIKRNEAEINVLKEQLFNYMSKSKRLEESLKKESDFCNSVLKEIKKFNGLFPIRKMFYRFSFSNYASIRTLSESI